MDWIEFVVMGRESLDMRSILVGVYWCYCLSKDFMGNKVELDSIWPQFIPRNELSEVS